MKSREEVVFEQIRLKVLRFHVENPLVSVKRIFCDEAIQTLTANRLPKSDFPLRFLSFAKQKPALMPYFGSGYGFSLENKLIFPFIPRFFSTSFPSKDVDNIKPRREEVSGWCP